MLAKTEQSEMCVAYSMPRRTLAQLVLTVARKTIS